MLTHQLVYHMSHIIVFRWVQHMVFPKRMIPCGNHSLSTVGRGNTLFQSQYSAHELNQYIDCKAQTFKNSVQYLIIYFEYGTLRKWQIIWCNYCNNVLLSLYKADFLYCNRKVAQYAQSH